jgi:hypothetical protein
MGSQNPAGRNCGVRRDSSMPLPSVAGRNDRVLGSVVGPNYTVWFSLLRRLCADLLLTIYRYYGSGPLRSHNHFVLR